jgi:hypothetical protein
MAITGEQKDVIEQQASAMVNNGFTKVYEDYFQKAVEEGDIATEDLKEAEKYFSEKLKELI